MRVDLGSEDCGGARVDFGVKAGYNTERALSRINFLVGMEAVNGCEYCG